MFSLKLIYDFLLIFLFLFFFYYQLLILFPSPFLLNVSYWLNGFILLWMSVRARERDREGARERKEFWNYFSSTAMATGTRFDDLSLRTLLQLLTVSLDWVLLPAVAAITSSIGANLG